MKGTGWFILITMILLLAIQNPGASFLCLGVFVLWAIFRYRRTGRFPNIIGMIERLFVDTHNCNDQYG